jgi:hypothetical protein
LKTIVLLHKDSNEIIEIIKQLKNQYGLVVNKDFEFSYQAGKWDEMVGDIPKQTKFTFFEDRWATLFVLKWS